MSRSTIEDARNRHIRKPQQFDSLGSINLGDSIESKPGQSVYGNQYNA